MELFLLLGLLAGFVLVALGGVSYLNQRRAGTVLAVPLSARTMGRHSKRAQTGRASSAHK